MLVAALTVNHQMATIQSADVDVLGGTSDRARQFEARTTVVLARPRRSRPCRGEALVIALPYSPAGRLQEVGRRPQGPSRTLLAHAVSLCSSFPLLLARCRAGAPTPVLIDAPPYRLDPSPLHSHVQPGRSPSANGSHRPDDGEHTVMGASHEATLRQYRLLNSAPWSLSETSWSSVTAWSVTASSRRCESRDADGHVAGHRAGRGGRRGLRPRRAHRLHRALGPRPARSAGQRLRRRRAGRTASWTTA